MQIIETGFKGLFVIEPAIFNDERGYFYESYNKQRYFDLGLDADFVQDNESKSTYGVIRGLHFQIEAHAQTKLLRVVEGRILDVALDVRIDSQTYGSFYAVELSAENKRQFYIPKGFAHGFSVLSETAIVNYKCDNFYNKESERGVHPLDPTLDIDWMVNKKDAVLSEKDTIWPGFNDMEVYF